MLFTPVNHGNKSLAKQVVSRLNLLGSLFGQDLRALLLTSVDNCSLWSESNFWAFFPPFGHPAVGSRFATHLKRKFSLLLTATFRCTVLIIDDDTESFIFSDFSVIR